MSEVMSEACRAVLRFPQATKLTILFTITKLLVLAFGITVFFHLLSLDYFEFPSLLLLLLHCLNICGTIWLHSVIDLFRHMVLWGTFCIWFQTMDKLNVPRGLVSRNVVTALRYHIGTAAYGSLIWVTFPDIYRIIKNSNKPYRTIFSLYKRVHEISMGITSIYGKSFKESADTVCQLYSQLPECFFSVSKKFLLAAIVLNGILSSTIIISSEIIFYSLSISYDVQVTVLLILVIFIIVVTAPVIVILNAAVISRLFCTLKVFEHNEKDIRKTFTTEFNQDNFLKHSKKD
ncbi:CTL-like protein 2 [Copidosoma floridanum]|uniref:CTL-like protein 2 n=1 Tax=Copidosoma floridanum TaxID=29053 RepID=UPI0006C9AE7C|nr:CTL-like protein 2 [Copidosoma floridanum]